MKRLISFYHHSNNSDLCRALEIMTRQVCDERLGRRRGRQ